jgi:hypothetical protein
MPFPQILGDIGALATKGMRIPRVGAKTPPMLPPGLKQPSGAGMSGPLPEPTLSSGSPRPDQPDQPDENTGSGGILPMPQSLKQPPMTPGMQQLSDLYKQGAPPPATGVRGKIGGVFNALGWNWAGNPLKYPGLDVYQGQLARAQGLSNVEDEALKRQEAQQRIAESTENMRAMRDYRQNVALDKAQGTYDRRMENVQKAGGFEAPSVPPSTDRVEMPPNPLTSIPAGSGMQGPDESDVVRNLPQRNLILSPGLQPEQSSSLGTVENLKDPSSGETTSMVRPNLKTQAEMRKVDAPQDIVDFYKSLPPEFTKNYPVSVPNVPPDGKMDPAEVKRLESKYQRDSAALQAFNGLKTKPEKMDQVALAIKAAGGDPANPASVTPQIAAKAAGILKPQQPGVQLTPEAIQMAAQMYATTGQLPSLGMGSSGASARSQILNAAPKVGGDTNIAANKATYRADSGSLAQAQKMRDSVVAFEKTASKNLDLFTNQAKKVIDSGSPWINQPLRSIDRNALGNADQAAFDAARQVALTEIAKVVNNPSLSSVLSDTARREVLSLNPENATLAQINSVASILKQDMANRRTSLDQQITEIKGRMAGERRRIPLSCKPQPALST